MTKIKILTSTIALFSILILHSCAYYGGGTIGTGLPMASIDNTSNRTGIIYISFSGNVYNKSGLPLKNTKINFVTSKIEDSVLTDESGYFNIELITPVDENIEIVISQNNKVYKNKFTIKNNNATSGTANFVLQESGLIEISELSVY